jgi:hypothetical protein
MGHFENERRFLTPPDLPLKKGEEIPMEYKKQKHSTGQFPWNNTEKRHSTGQFPWNNTEKRHSTGQDLGLKKVAGLEQGGKEIERGVKICRYEDVLAEA